MSTTSKPLHEQNLIDVVRLIRSENVGPVTFKLLIKKYGTAAKALEKIPELSLKGGRSKPITLCPKSVAETEIEKTKLFGAQMIVFGSPDYPQGLLEIDDAPPVLAVQGHPHLWQQKKLVAMVGARNASANGCNFAKKIARELGEAGFVVVSGLARGIDTYAHRGSLATGTVGVIAGGIDNIYPPENEALYNEMRNAGAVVSENAFSTAPQSRNFPARNRIISGLSLGVIVVEASKNSGSLITARFAAEQGREVMAVPGSPLDPRCNGTNGLLKDGAAFIESTQDVIEALSSRTRGHAAQGAREGWLPGFEEIDESEIEERQRGMLLEKLSVIPVAVDDLVAQTNLPANVILTILLEKELAGMVQRHPGGKVSLLYLEQEKVSL